MLAEAAYISAQGAAGTTAAGRGIAVGLIKNKVLKIYNMSNLLAWEMQKKKADGWKGTLQAVESQIATSGNAASLTA